jgi:YbbR domain-containing protein
VSERRERPAWRPGSGHFWADLGTWLLAFTLAVGLWFFVNAGARTSERTLRVRLDLVHLPSGMVITNPVPDYVEVRASGSGLMLSSIDAKDVRVSLDLGGVRPGLVTYTLSARDFGLPRNVEVDRVTPSRVSLQVDRLKQRTVPVRLAYQGVLDNDLRIVEAQVLPAEVAVTGPRTRIEALRSIEAAPVDRASLTPGVNERTLDVLNPGGLLQIPRTAVAAQIVVERDLRERVFEDVPIELKGERPRWRLEPERLRLVVRGPASEMAQLELAPGAVYVDPTDWTGEEPREVRPEVTLPPGFEVVTLEPETVGLSPVPPATDDTGGPEPTARSRGEKA